jgi:F0F1-type ATP synthase assembly protein I
VENLTHALAGAWVGWLTCAFFLSQAYKFLSFIIMAMSVAVLNAMAKEGVEINNSWGPKQWGQTLVVTTGAVVILYMAINVLWRFAQN